MYSCVIFNGESIISTTVLSWVEQTFLYAPLWPHTSAPPPRCLPIPNLLPEVSASDWAAWVSYSYVSFPSHSQCQPNLFYLFWDPLDLAKVNGKSAYTHTHAHMHISVHTCVHTHARTPALGDEEKDTAISHLSVSLIFKNPWVVSYISKEKIISRTPFLPGV